MPETVSSRQVIGFRLRAHHLDERLGEDGLLDAVGRCGIQDSPPGSALLSLRGAPHWYSTSDAPVFTAGALPPTEEGRQHLLPGVVPSLRSSG